MYNIIHIVVVRPHSSDYITSKWYRSKLKSNIDSPLMTFGLIYGILVLSLLGSSYTPCIRLLFRCNGLDYMVLLLRSLLKLCSILNYLVDIHIVNFSRKLLQIRFKLYTTENYIWLAPNLCAVVTAIIYYDVVESIYRLISTWPSSVYPMSDRKFFIDL